jgi:phospholipase D1/2
LLIQPEHIFFFNLRSYDRINKTAKLEKQEELSGVRYQDIQRAEAEEIMSESIHPSIGKEGDRTEKDYSNKSRDPAKVEKRVDQLRRFEAQREKTYGEQTEIKSKDTIAEDAMLNQKKVSEEVWENEDPETEKENFIQEELYIHGKVCIVDDRTIICGSANINDRVSFVSFFCIFKY